MTRGPCRPPVLQRQAVLEAVLAGAGVRRHSTRSSRRRYFAGTAVAGEGMASGRDLGEAAHAVHIQDYLGEGTGPAGAAGGMPGIPGRLVDHKVQDVGCIGADRKPADPLVGNSPAVVEGNDPAEGGRVLGLAGHSNRRHIDSAGVHRTTC